MTAARPAVPSDLGVDDLLWVGAAALFIGLRVAAAVNFPVAGAELDHLSGAWRASLGLDDDRFVPTLFQSLSALLLKFDASETWPRVLALAGASTVPAALWCLRGRLGDGGSLLALLFLAFDPAGILATSTASALAWDVPIAVWAVVALMHGWPNRRLARGVAAALGFFVFSAGPIPLALAGGLVALNVAGRAGIRNAPAPRLLRDRLDYGALAAGGAVAILAASFRWGLGAQELVVPPFDLFSRASEAAWSNPGGDILVLYELPLVLVGLGALGVVLWEWWLSRIAGALPALLAGWAITGLLWAGFAIPDHNPFALVAATTPLCLLLGHGTIAAAKLMLRADWTLARWTLPAAAVLALMAAAIVFDWAELERTGSGREQLKVAVFLVAALVALAVQVATRARATLFVVPMVLGIPWLAAGALPLVMNGTGEPLLTPYSPPQARELRRLTLETAGERGGTIAIHPTFEDALTWPFRDSGTIELSSRAPEGAVVLVWPAAAPPPPGYVVVPGEWALTRDIPAPTDGWLNAVHWYIDRGIITPRPANVVLYTKEKP